MTDASSGFDRAGTLPSTMPATYNERQRSFVFAMESFQLVQASFGLY